MRSIYLGTTLVGMFILGCSGSSTNTAGSGGSIASGGTQPGGGAANTGGGVTTGGAVATGGSSVATGGNGAGGVSAATGGASSSTGGAAGGQSTGGQATGGKSSTSSTNAGGQATGGKSAAGGTSATGGQATGGKSAAGGTSATGGKSAGGGTSATGGQATGGKSAAGGTSATGGQATGGGTSAGGAARSSGCNKAPGIASSQYNNGTSINITAAGMQRRYVLQVPTNYDNTHAYKLVVTFHARDGNDKQMYSWQYYGLLSPSNNTAIFVAPNGQLNGSPCSGTSSSGEGSCGWPNTNDSDLALADAVVAQIEENFCIDTDRIFATGWSYGGSMSYRTACSRPLSKLGSASWGVRAIAIYSAAQLSGNCTPSSPVGYYHSHGTHDSVLDYENMGMPLAKNFASANGCTWATPPKVTSGNHVCTNLTGCKTGYPLEFCSFNGDHTPFPDTGQSSGSWGPPEAWKFLNQF
jgi:poly(3-hydroxybutyrate) depolymerase